MSPTRLLIRPHKARGSRQLGSRLPVLRAVPRPPLHFRNGVSEHVFDQTAQAPSSQRVPATQCKKKTPCNRNKLKRIVQSLLLCLRRECRLRHSPTVKGRTSDFLRREKPTRRRSHRHLHSTSLEEDLYQSRRNRETQQGPCPRTPGKRVPVMPYCVPLQSLDGRRISRINEFRDEPDVPSLTPEQTCTRSRFDQGNTREQL